MDGTLQDLRGNSEVMGGDLLILSGDFGQTLPVIPKSTPTTFLATHPNTVSNKNTMVDLPKL